MKSKYQLLLFTFLVFLFSCSKDNESTKPIIDPVTESPLLKLSGKQIVDADNNPVYLQGVAFGNEIWINSPLPIKTHHAEIDFQRVKAMGMNVVRFYLNYRTFEDDSNPYTYKQTAWDWIDTNIEWAKKNGVYLILNMHAPQGGYQSGGEGDALWTDVENQNRLVALWKAIAERYKDEGQIAGFGPVNEPIPTTSMDQWTQLSKKIIDGIRTVDENHLLFIEKAIFVKGAPADDNLNFPKVSGKNIVFEFHNYDPNYYTHQLLEFAGLGDGGKYPDENKLEAVNAQWYTANLGNPKAVSGSSDWKHFEGLIYKVTDTKVKIGRPSLVGANVGVGGKVYFDDIIIKEYDENGLFVRDIIDIGLTSTKDWYFWSKNESGTVGQVSSEGHNDMTSLYIENATDDCNLSNPELSFIVKQNYSYQINGWIKGAAIGNGSNCNIRLDFFSTDGAILKRNKAYLEATIKSVTDWANTKNVALYMGEFGAGSPCFENNKGGLQYVEDMVTIAKENKIPFTYHDYHEESFGIYRGNGSLPNPNNVNQPLIDLFTNILKD